MIVPTNSYMMQLGEYQFSVSKASFNKINYESNYRWEPKEAPTSNSPPLMQYIGPGERSMTINGTIYPQLIKDGLEQINQMRAQAENKKMLPLVYVEGKGKSKGLGRILGKWCILSISEERTLFLPDGNPREINFTIQLKSFENRNVE